jgi:NAD(P)-dependent dehydrogenase (short-subunit alcohol dehydrogenase family)
MPNSVIIGKNIGVKINTAGVISINIPTNNNKLIIKRTPAARWGTPEDLQGTAVFLSSNASDFVNGYVVYVDGSIDFFLLYLNKSKMY